MLFYKAVNFDIPVKDKRYFYYDRQMLIFNNNQSLLRKSGNEELDVPMGCFDSVEVCDIVGVYIVHLLKSVMRKENVSLYRDDVLGILRNSSGPQIKQKRKQTIPTFQRLRTYHHI